MTASATPLRMSFVIHSALGINRACRIHARRVCQDPYCKSPNRIQNICVALARNCRWFLHMSPSILAAVISWRSTLLLAINRSPKLRRTPCPRRKPHLTNSSGGPRPKWRRRQLIIDTTRAERHNSDNALILACALSITAYLGPRRRTLTISKSFSIHTVVSRG